MTEKKPVLAIDVDEVLAYFVPSLAEFHNEYYRCETGSLLTAESFVSYDFCKVWGGTMEESYVKVGGDLTQKLLYCFVFLPYIVFL